MLKNYSGFLSGIEHSMAALFSDPAPDVEPQFYRDLQTARFLVPLGKSGNLALLGAQNFNGDYIPAFTSEREQRSGPMGSNAEVYSYQTLKHLILDDLSLGGIVINPFGKQIILQRAQIEEMESAISDMYVNRTFDVKYFSISEAKGCSEELLSAISLNMKSRPEVYKVYIISAARKGEAAPHLTFVVDFDGDEGQLFPYFAEIIRPFMRVESSFVYFELIKASYDLMMQIEAARIVPVYKKG